MSTIKISSVSYINSLPFIYGIEKSGILKNYKLELDVPSVCAKKLSQNEVDIALLPVGAFPDSGQFRIISDFCIGADGNVASVLLLGNKDISLTKRIFLDNDSRTSVKLTKLLAKEYWKIEPEWENYTSSVNIYDNDSLLAIGDKAMAISKNYLNITDLAYEWKCFTSLPFVFAVWAANKEIPDFFSEEFNRALEWGVNNRVSAVKEDARYNNKFYNTNLVEYIHNNISYPFDEAKKKGLNLFLEMVKKNNL